MDARNRRQLEAMRDQIEAYEVGRIDLPWLISSLEALRNALEEFPAEWLEAFSKHWGNLEELYSISVVRETSLPPQAREEVRGSVDEIKALVEGLLAVAGKDD
jgi:hypothetical protein